MKKEIKTNNAPKPIGPYSQAIETENLLFVSGQIAQDSKTGKIDNDSIEIETKKVMENIGAILKKANLDYKDIVKSSIFISDIKQFNAINSIYGEYFSPPYPARETIEVSCLPKNVNIEISVVAKK